MVLAGFGLEKMNTLEQFMFRMAFALKKMNTLELFMFSNYIQSQKDE